MAAFVKAFGDEVEANSANRPINGAAAATATTAIASPVATASMDKLTCEIHVSKQLRATRWYTPWLVLAFAAANVIFLGGKRRAFGVFVAQLHVEFKDTVSLAELNWIGDSYAAVGYLTTTISTSLILGSGRRYALFQFFGSCFVLLACATSAFVPNAHWLFLTHTVFHGIGSSFILSTVGLIVNEHFDKDHQYHILATTLISGGSVASIVFVQLYAYLIDTYTWRTAFLYLGFIYFAVNTSACFVFVKNDKLEEYVPKSNKCAVIFKEKIDPEKYPFLILWFFDRVMTSIVTYGMLMNLADYVRRRETSMSKSSHLTLMFAAGEASTYAIGAVIGALTKDFLHNKLKWILLVLTGAMSCFLVMWEIVAKNEYWSFVLSYSSGFCLGPSITFLFPAGEELTLLPGYMAYPFSLAGMGVGMAISPSVSGLIAEKYQYRYFFIIQGFLIFLKFCALLMLCILIRRYHARKEKLPLYQSVAQSAPEDIPSSCITADKLNGVEHRHPVRATTKKGK